MNMQIIDICYNLTSKNNIERGESNDTIINNKNVIKRTNSYPGRY